MENYMRTNALKEPRPTDRKLDFGTYQAVVRAVNRLGVPLDMPPSETLIQLMELDEDLPAYDENALPVNGVMPWDGKRATPPAWLTQQLSKLL